MHQKSSPYTNDDNDSDKENIPPIYSYPMPSNTRSAERQALNHTPLQEISPSPDPNDIVVTASPELTSEPTSKALIKRTGNCPICRLPYVYDHIAWCCGLTMDIPANVTKKCHHLSPKHPETILPLPKLPCLSPPYNNWMNSTPTKPPTFLSGRKSSISPPSLPLTMPITPIAPSNTRSR